MIIIVLKVLHVVKWLIAGACDQPAVARVTTTTVWSGYFDV